MRQSAPYRSARIFGTRPAWGAVRGVLAAMLVLAVLAVTSSVVEAAPAPRPAPAAHVLDDEGGACGEVDEEEQLVSCGQQFEWTPSEPLALTVLRSLGLQTTEAICDELLADIWSRQTCEASGIECGKLNAGVPARVPPKLARSSSSARASLADDGLDGAPVRRLGLHVAARPPKSRDLQPPVPPPKLARP